MCIHYRNVAVPKYSPSFMKFTAAPLIMLRRVSSTRTSSRAPAPRDQSVCASCQAHGFFLNSPQTEARRAMYQPWRIIKSNANVVCVFFFSSLSLSLPPIAGAWCPWGPLSVVRGRAVHNEGSRLRGPFQTRWAGALFLGTRLWLVQDKGTCWGGAASSPSTTNTHFSFPEWAYLCVRADWR